jgi:hypothetical protein
MIKSMAQSGIVLPKGYTSMLVGNLGFIPITPSTYFPGDGDTASTQINKMPYSTETFSTLSATLTFARTAQAAFNSQYSGYVVGAGNINKFYIPADTNASFAGALYSIGGYFAAQVPSVSALFIDYDGSSTASAAIRIWSFSNDTTTASSSLSSMFNSVIGPSATYTFSTNGPTVYFGGGSPFSSYAYGGLVRYVTTTNTATTVYTDSTANSRTSTEGSNNGSTAAYLAGGWSQPVQTFTTSIRKLPFSTETFSTLSATLSVARVPARVGVQKDVCAYYGGGRATGSSLATSATSVDKLTFATDTVAVSSTAVVNRNGRASWNTY